MRFDFCARCGVRIGLIAPCTCPACGAEFWANPKPCAGALVARGGRLLLVRRALDPWKDHWDIPGGFCDANEHPRETAVRELREETGLDITLDRQFGMWLDTYGQQHPPEVTLNIYFLAHPTRDGDEPNRSTEVAEAAWFAPGSLPSAIAFPHHATAVLDRWREQQGLDGGVT